MLQIAKGTRISKCFALAAGAITMVALAGCSDTPNPAGSTTGSNSPEIGQSTPVMGGAAAELGPELAAVRQATAQFHDPSTAIGAGYLSPLGGHCDESLAGAMGVHSSKPALVQSQVLDPLQEHRDPFQAVRDLTGDRGQVHSSDLLEVGELRDLEAVEHHLPADAPCAERWRLPVVFFEPDVVLTGIDATRFKAVEIQLLHLVG